MSVGKIRRTEKREQSEIELGLSEREKLYYITSYNYTIHLHYKYQFS